MTNKPVVDNCFSPMLTLSFYRKFSCCRPLAKGRTRNTPNFFPFTYSRSIGPESTITPDASHITAMLELARHLDRTSENVKNTYFTLIQ